MATTLVSLDQRSIEMVIALQRYAGEPFESVIARALREALGNRSQPGPEPPVEKPGSRRFRITLLGEAYEVATAREVLVTVLQRLHGLDGQFLSKLSRETGRTRRIVAPTPEAIYPGRPDLAKYACRLTDGWYVGRTTRCAMSIGFYAWLARPQASNSALTWSSWDQAGPQLQPMVEVALRVAPVHAVMA